MRPMTSAHYLKHRRFFEPALWLVYLTLNLVAQVGVATRDAGRFGDRFAAWEPVSWEATSLLMIALLLPAILAFDRRFPIQRPNTIRHALAHLAFSIPFSIIHVLGMVALRKLVYYLAGSNYDFGNWTQELAYEYLKDLRTYFGLLALIYLYRLALRRWQGEAEFLSEGTEDQPATPVRDRFLVKKLGREFLVRVDDIDWIEASGNYVNLHVRERVYPLRDTMTGMIEKLRESGFARVHRSAIINLDRVTHIEPFASGDARVLINDRDDVPVSRRYRQQLKDALG